MVRDKSDIAIRSSTSITKRVHRPPVLVQRRAIHHLGNACQVPCVVPGGRASGAKKRDRISRLVNGQACSKARTT